MHQKYGVLKNDLNQKHFTLKPVNMLSVFDQVQLQTTFFAELGRVSLQCQRHINILNFFAPLSSLDSKRYASKAFIMLTKDADYGHYNWVSHARDLQARYEIYESDTRSVIKTEVIKHCESEVLHRLYEHITESQCS